MKIQLTKKLLTLGISSMILCTSCITAFASNDAGFNGTRTKGNPVTSAPWGKAKTTADYDVDSIGAKITVWNDGDYTDSDSKEKTWSHSVVTGKVYGANYDSDGTSFEAYYYGTDADSSPTFWEDCDDWSY